MNSRSSSLVFTIGLAVFTLLFGAGNLIYPLMVGMNASTYTPLAMLGFIITAVLLPLTGFIAMILFDGNYEAFFGRLGKTAGAIAIFICMMIIGPVVAIPRTVTLSHVMIAPFLPFNFLQTINPLSSFVFALFFLGTTFLMTYKESRIMDLLSYVISPLLIGSLVIIIGKGIFTAQSVVPVTFDALTSFKTSLTRGYETLDLLGMIFFASIIIHILKNNLGHMTNMQHHRLIATGLKGGFFGAALLTLVYVGMSILGVYHSHGLAGLNGGELFREIAFRVTGTYGTIIIAIAVLMACLSTAVGLSAVLAEYIQKTVFGSRISYVAGLTIITLLSFPLSIFGLGKVLALTGGPIVYIGYPVIIALTFCNIAYKLWGFTPVRIPVLATFVAAAASYFI
jgi:LIVCS family branched-chain amino acid:cation transporter